MTNVSTADGNGNVVSPKTVLQALNMSGEEIDELFRSQSAGSMPSGRSVGTALMATGSPVAKLLAGIARVGFWQGKTFNRVEENLKNRLTPIGLPAIIAKVEFGESIFDQKPCIVLDYSKTSRVARFIRDEIRQVGPHDYLGIVFVKDRKIPLRFWLHFP